MLIRRVRLFPFISSSKFKYNGLKINLYRKSIVRWTSESKEASPSEEQRRYRRSFFTKAERPYCYWERQQYGYLCGEMFIENKIGYLGQEGTKDTIL